VKETDEDTKSYLGYKIIDTDKTVDAKTKGILSTSYKPSYSIYGTVFNRIMGNISNEKEIELINSKKIVNGEEAGKKIIDTFELGKEYEISDYRLKGIEEKDIYIWEVMIMKRVGNHGSGTSSRIDAKTGEIIDFSDPGYMGEDEEKSKYSKEELLKKAKEIIKNMSLEKYKEVEYIENENEDLFYRDRNLSSFVFIRKVNGIEVENNGFRITLSNLTGDVMSYNCNWNDLEFEAPENIISKDKAKEILLEDIELDLGYQIENEENEENEEKNVKLVYDFNEKYLTVDAKKAEIVGDREEIIEQTIVEKYDDIESSFAKEQIEKLQNYIILFEGEKLKPKQEITQKEFFKLLVQTIDIFYSYEDENYMYERLIGEGILKNEEKNIEAKITREEAIKYIIRAFGQEPLEDLGNIYKLEYHDVDKISSDLKGHIAIAKGLGLISEGRNFRPKDNLTREEAAVLVYNILNRDR
ncbi:S-layer homology domain-containing protein, partial [Schnuerera sp.]|uniref:S-layer homology domain-containing protein n=1 Tax=Schnuerera sp. TaxID=2794844 RepID=UPI002C00EB44